MNIQTLISAMSNRQPSALLAEIFLTAVRKSKVSANRALDPSSLGDIRMALYDYNTWRHEIPGELVNMDKLRAVSIPINPVEYLLQMVEALGMLETIPTDVGKYVEEYNSSFQHK